MRIKNLWALLSLLCAASYANAAEGDAYEWPAYSPNIYYNFNDEVGTVDVPTKDVDGDCIKAAAGVKSKQYWSFIYGANRCSKITDTAIENLLNYFNQEFDYITNDMGWPRDSRVQNGYRSAVYLYGSMDCTGSNDTTATGGWQTTIDGYPAVSASYYPVYSFDPSCPYSDRVSQMNAMIHEGIHCILTDLGAKYVHWFQEGGNTWLQQEMAVRRGTTDKTKSNAYSGMGFLNGACIIAPFMPIECYSGWLLDGSFGGPGGQGVGGNNWRTYLGGTQYSNIFPTFLGVWISSGAVPWLWKNTPSIDGSNYILETMAGQMGDAQIRRLIMEYRAKLAMLDMQGWSENIRTLLNDNFGRQLGCEAEDSNWDSDCSIKNVAKWYATPYQTMTEQNGVLTPNSETTPGWSGANIVPLTVNGTTVKVKLTPIGDNMSLQLCYRATDGTPVYSEPVMGEGSATLRLDKTPQSGVVFAVVCNTDYAYKGNETRTKHHNYTLTLENGISGAADAKTRWYNDFNLQYDWSSVCNNCDEEEVKKESEIETIYEENYEVSLPIASDYASASVYLDATALASKFNMTAAELIAANINFYGVNSNGTFYKTSTANDPGHWFNNSGDVVAYSNEKSTIYSELTLDKMLINIGHYPDRVSVGDKYTVSQAFVVGMKAVKLNFNVTITAQSTGVESIANTKKDMLNVYYSDDDVVAEYTVPFNNVPVKLSLYTATGSLLTHFVNAIQSQGDYTHALKLSEAGLNAGVYLLKLSYPSHSETKVIRLK